MVRPALLASVAALALAFATPADAQQPVSPPPAKDTTAAAARVATEAAADSAVRELGRAVAVLASSVQKIVKETAEDPELRLAAVQVAGQATTLAQRTLAENMSEIERMLAEASRALSDLEAEQKAKVGKKQP
jgi:hypothetical protein